MELVHLTIRGLGSSSNNNMGPYSIQTYSCLALKTGGDCSSMEYNTSRNACIPNHATYKSLELIEGNGLISLPVYLKVTIHWPHSQLSIRNDSFISQTFATLDL